jgi:hypothetical protein
MNKPTVTSPKLTTIRRLFLPLSFFDKNSQPEINSGKNQHKTPSTINNIDILSSDIQFI